MKKMLTMFIIFALIFGLTVTGHATMTESNATNARTASIDKISGGTVGVTDLSSGKTQEVDAKGAAVVRGKRKEVETTTSSATLVEKNDAPLYLSKIIVTAGTANKSVAIRDGGVTGTILIEIEVGTADSTVVIDCDEAYFANGLYVDLQPGTSDVQVTVIFDDDITSTRAR